MELKSAQQIIKILQDEKVNSYNLKNQVNPPKLVHKAPENKSKKKWISSKANHTSENSKMVKHKIRILGDSHSRGLANELKCKLTQEFEIQGMVKPGCTVDKLVSSSTLDPKDLTMSDVCIVWGCTNDVGRNETIAGIRVLRHFVGSHSHTNVIVLSVPQRHDLTETSCVNLEVKVFNRMLDKLKKAYQNLTVVTVDTNRDFYTRHGLHLNSREETFSKQSRCCDNRSV
jgi:hypothetical protein